MTILLDALVLILVALAMWAGHWTPWRVLAALVDSSLQLRRTLAYTYGCGVILLGFVAWALAQAAAIATVDAVVFLALEMLAAAIGTIAPRAVRLALEAQALREDVADLEKKARLEQAHR